MPEWPSWIARLKNFLTRRDDEGQGVVEYGLILGLITVIAIAALNASRQPAPNNVLGPTASPTAQSAPGR